jgi:hypothetical protein
MADEFVEIRHGKQVAKIAIHGGGLAQYYVEQGDNKIHLAYGYDSKDAKESGMGDILGPW